MLKLNLKYDYSVGPSEDINSFCPVSKNRTQRKLAFEVLMFHPFLADREKWTCANSRDIGLKTFRNCSKITPENPRTVNVKSLIKNQGGFETKGASKKSRVFY